MPVPPTSISAATITSHAMAHRDAHAGEDGRGGGRQDHLKGTAQRPHFQRLLRRSASPLLTAADTVAVLISIGRPSR